MYLFVEFSFIFLPPNIMMFLYKMKERITVLSNRYLLRQWTETS